MATTISTANNGQPTTVAPGNGGLSTENIIIIVGVIAGSLLLIVVIMLCIVACLYHKNTKNSEGDEKRKPKKEPEYRDRIYRPVDWENPEGPDGGHDITEIGEILFRESASRRGSIAMRNPAYREDEEDGKTLENTLSNGHAYPMPKLNGNGPPRPPKLEMLPPERRQSSKSDESSRPRSQMSPSSPTDTQISILDKRTWGAPDLTANIDDAINDDDDNRPSSNSEMNTVSGPHNDPGVDFSVFGSNMRGSVMQDRGSMRRSFRSRNQAIVDYYESGYSNSIGTRSAVSLPMSRMDYQIESDDKPTSEYGTGNRMLWQKRKFET